MNFTRISLLALVLAFAVSTLSPADDWPQWRGPNRDGVWREDKIVKEFEEDQIEIVWRQEIGAGYSGPTVADDRVFVTDRITEPKQMERIHAFDAKTGAKLWSHEYECSYKIGYTAGPRAAVTVDGSRAFALGAMGHLHCLDVGGAVLWKRDLAADYKIRMPIWGIAGAPLVVDDLVILHIGGEEACVVALEKKSGEEAWRALPNDRAQYTAPILIEQAGQQVVIVWTGDSVAGLKPASGEVLWRYPFAPQKMPIGVATPVVSENRLFMTSFYDGSLLLRLKQEEPAVEKLWHRTGQSELKTDALQSIISTPVFDKETIYGVDSHGEFRALSAKNGDRLWEDKTATSQLRWGTIHFVRHEDRYFLFNDQGELIIAELSPEGFREIDRAKLLSPTQAQLSRRNGVTWSHPAFANRSVFARNDKELVCGNLEM